MARRLYPDKLPTPVAVLGWDGFDFRVILVDADHHLQADVLSSALPAGAALEATLSNIQDNVGSRTDPAAGSANAQLADLLGGQAPLGIGRICETAWDIAIGAGATSTILAETAGSGYVTHVMFRADGIAEGAYGSRVVITLDDTKTATFTLNEVLYMNNGAILGFCHLECMKWDATGHVYWAQWKVRIPFLSNIKIDITNGDGANPIVARALIAYSLDT